MESRKFSILFAAVFAIVAISVSCTSYQQMPINWPSTQNPPIATVATMIEVTGDKGEKLSVNLDSKTGECVSIQVVGEKEPRGCDDPAISSKRENTYYCIPPKIADEPANTVIGDSSEKNMYCGKVTFLTYGTDIQIKSRLDPEARNRKCKNIGGIVFCYPPLD